MARKYCFFSANCECLLVWLFLINVYFGRTISGLTIAPSTRNISNESEVSQLSSTINPKIRQALCKEPNSSPAPVTQNSSVQASTPSHKAGCLRSNGAPCNTYVGSWSYFYLRVSISKMNTIVIFNRTDFILFLL